MCRRCLQNAEVNALNAQAVKDLTEAAATLAVNVPKSDAALKAIIGRIEIMAKLPEEEKVSGETGTASAPEPEAELPPDLQKLKEIFEHFGIKTDFIDVSRKL